LSGPPEDELRRAGIVVGRVLYDPSGQLRKLLLQWRRDLILLQVRSTSANLQQKLLNYQTVIENTPTTIPCSPKLVLAAPTIILRGGVSTRSKHVIYIIKRTALRSEFEIWLEPMATRRSHFGEKVIQTSTPWQSST